jgi:hypothetical protein
MPLAGQHAPLAIGLVQCNLLQRRCSGATAVPLPRRCRCGVVGCGLVGCWGGSSVVAWGCCVAVAVFVFVHTSTAVSCVLVLGVYIMCPQYSLLVSPGLRVGVA